MATIRDVAKTAGVSIATVSRVFNGNTAVSEDTALQVWAAASALDYWPNGAARSLTTSRSNTLGVLLPDLFGDFFSEVIRGIDQLAKREKYQTLVSGSHASVEDVLTATRAMRGRIDGLVMMAPDSITVESVTRIRRRLPVVLISPPFAVDGCSSVSVASFSGARAAVAHLVGLGHREIAMVAGPVGNVDAEERLRGYRRGLAEAGISPRDELVVQGDFRESSGYAAAAALLDRRPRPTAVFAANDCMAIGLMSALGNAGLSVPQDMAVVGFDNITMAQYMRPPLTTVHVDAYALGQKAVRLMLDALADPEGEKVTVQTIDAVLKVRSSCGARPASATDAAIGPEANRQR